MILVLREERITSTAGSFCACVFDDACVQTTLTVPTAGRVPAASALHRASTATLRGGCSPKHQGHRQQIVRDHICLSLLFCDIFSRHLGEWPATLSRSPDPKQPQWVPSPSPSSDSRSHPARSCLDPPSHHGRGRQAHKVPEASITR